MKQQQFSIEDYRAATKREIQKRITTYPKIITKMRKRGDEQQDIEQVYMNQEMQMRLLKYCSALIRGYPERTCLDGAFLDEILAELMRELKERKRCYPRWVKLYRMMTQETADYEIHVWESLTRWFAKEYLDLDELPTRRKKKP